MPTGKLKTRGRAGWCGWERPLRLEMHFQSNLLSPYQPFSFKLRVMSLEERMRSKHWRGGEMLYPLTWKNTQEERWGKIRGPEWWRQESRGLMLNTFLPLRKAKGVIFWAQRTVLILWTWKTWACPKQLHGEVGRLAHFTLISWVCCAQSLGSVLLSESYSCISKA